MHDRADKLLQQARDRRAELLQILKSLDTAYQTQHRLQQQLIYARQKANEARLMKERFAANISHELRTPLNLIMGFSEIMYLNPEIYGDTTLSPRFMRDIHQIYGNSKYLLGLIDDILDLSHIEMTNFTINFEMTDINQFVNESRRLLSNLFQDHQVELIFDIAENLPMMEVDRTRLRQIFLNLLTNAKRFTSHGHVQLTIYATSRDLIIQVSDTGQGIPQDKINMIFDEFYQVDYSLSRSHGGAGLGLTITRRFIEAHAGRIDVESTVGVGTIFTITLPINTLHPTLSSDFNQDHKQSNINKPVVLVLDKDENIVQLLMRQLKEFDIVPVPTMDTLDTAIPQLQPSAIIVNHVEPLFDLSQYPDLPVIECSLPSIRWFVDQLGVLDCLPKPITAQVLRDRIRELENIRTILLVDDDMGFVQLVQRTIELIPQPYQIIRAYDGIQALEMIDKTRPDLILLDLAMPEMNGFGVLDALQSNPDTQDIPVILLTATRYIESEFEANTSLKLYKHTGFSAYNTIATIQAILQHIV
jgi:signal transduction histidine kinase